VGPLEVSAHPDTEEGARDFVRALLRAARSSEDESWQRLRRELVPDGPRYDLGLSFEGARRTREGVIEAMEARAPTLRRQFAAMREPIALTVRSATGAELARGAPHGFDPEVERARAYVRPAVRYVRVDVTDADGRHVVLQPMAFLAGRWTWMGDFWRQLPVPTAADEGSEQRATP
jgi:Arc/MetJ-type ribon-helix-helix transcriptional regulator